MYYAFTADSVFKLVPPNGSESTWQTSMLYSDIVPLIYEISEYHILVCQEGSAIVPLIYVMEKEMATHSSVLAWRIPGTGEPGGLPSVGSHRVRHD